MTRIITVVGATGTQGGSVVCALLKDSSYHIRGLTRNANSDKAKALAEQGIEVISADLNSISSLESPLQGSHAIFAVTNFYEAFPSVSAAEALKQEVLLGTNLAKAALATSTLEHYIWSTFPDVRSVSGGTMTIPHYEGKARVDAFIRSTKLLQKTTFLWIPSYAQNMQYPWYTPFPLPGDSQTLYQLQATSPSAKWLLAGDVSTNIGLFVAAILAQPEKTLPGKIILAAVDSMTAGEVVSAWARREGKKGKVPQICAEKYCAIWPLWGELMHASHAYWQEYGENTFSRGNELVLGKEQLGVKSLVGTEEYFATV